MKTYRPFLRALFVSIVTALALCAQRAAAQDFSDYMSQYETGYGFEYITVNGYQMTDTVTGAQTPISQKLYSVAFTISFYYPLMPLNKMSSWGIQPAATVGVAAFEGFENALMRADVPIFLMYKYGTDADYYGRGKYGFGVGVGAVAQGMASPDNILYANTIGISPAITLEGSWMESKSTLMKLRFIATPIAASIDGTRASLSNGDDLPFHVDEAMYSLLLVFNRSF